MAAVGGELDVEGCIEDAELDAGLIDTSRPEFPVSNIQWQGIVWVVGS